MYFYNFYFIIYSKHVCYANVTFSSVVINKRNSANPLRLLLLLGDSIVILSALVYDKLWVITVLVLTRWLENFGKICSYHLVII